MAYDTPAHAHLIEGRAHGTSVAVAASAMPRPPLQRQAVDPPLLLGLLPPVGQWQWQHSDVTPVASCTMTMTPHLPSHHAHWDCRSKQQSTFVLAVDSRGM